MPITRKILSQFPADSFVETGTYKGAALELARSVGFRSFYSCDTDPRCVKMGLDRGFDNVRLASSPNFLRQVLPGLSGSVTFWLDAHPNLNPMDLNDVRVPLFDELAAIHDCANAGQHTILIDDLRTLSEADAALLVEVVRLYWPDAVIAYHDDDLAERDILSVQVAL